MTRARILTPRRVFWTCAAFAVPLLNPPLIVLLHAGIGGILLALGVDLALLWLAAKSAWTDPRRRAQMLLVGMLVTAGCTVLAALAEFLILYAIAAANCPPDAYECPF
jgi:hypothetical protein